MQEPINLGPIVMIYLLWLGSGMLLSPLVSYLMKKRRDKAEYWILGIDCYPEHIDIWKITPALGPLIIFLPHEADKEYQRMLPTYREAMDKYKTEEAEKYTATYGMEGKPKPDEED